jgi:hypothetical protein
VLREIPIDPQWVRWYNGKRIPEVTEMKATIHIVDEEFVEIDTRRVDERKRLTIGAAMGDLNRVRILKNNRGEILLQPLADIPASEVWLYTNREASELVQKGVREAGEGKISRVNTDDL